MAQADSLSITRRSILAGVAIALPAIASVPALAAPTLPSELGENLKAASEAFRSAGKAVADAEAQAQAWAVANPEPVRGARGDYKDLSAWVQARNAAWRSAGLAKTKIARERAQMLHADAIDEVVNFDAKTLPDIIAKTRLLAYDDPENSLATSIAYDLHDLAHKS